MSNPDIIDISKLDSWAYTISAEEYRQKRIEEEEKKMSKLEVVESWKCTDGEVFTDLNEANKHEAELDFDKHYAAANELWDGWGTVDADDVRGWLLSNKGLVQQFYSTMEGK